MNYSTLSRHVLSYARGQCLIRLFFWHILLLLYVIVVFSVTSVQAKQADVEAEEAFTGEAKEQFIEEEEEYSIGEEPLHKSLAFCTDETLAKGYKEEYEVIFVETPLQALEKLRKRGPHLSVREVREIRLFFTLPTEKKSENEPVHSTLLQNYPGLKELLSNYTLYGETQDEEVFFVTLSGMLKHLEQQKEENVSWAINAYKLLNTAWEVEKINLYDGLTFAGALQNIGMEVMRCISSVKNYFTRDYSSRNDDTNPRSLTNQERGGILQTIMEMNAKLTNPEEGRYVIRVDKPQEISPEITEALLKTNYKDSVAENQTTSSGFSAAGWLTNGMLACGVLSGFLPVSNALPSARPVFPRPDYNGYTPVDSHNITSAISTNPSGSFVAAEPINGSDIDNLPVTQKFEGRFSTGEHFLSGFPVENRFPLFDSINNASIDVSVPLQGEPNSSTMPILTRQALNDNKVKITLLPPAFDENSNLDEKNGTAPIIGDVTGDNNRIQLRDKSNTLLEQNVGVLAVNVSGNNNMLEHSGGKVRHSHKGYELNSAVTRLRGQNNHVAYTNQETQKLPEPLSLKLRVTAENDAAVTGIVMIFDGNEWKRGVSCGPGIYGNEGIVICRQLGFERYFSTSGRLSSQGITEEDVILNGRACGGYEVRLSDCKPVPVDRSCSDIREVFISCYNSLRLTEDTQTGANREVTTDDGAGRLELYQRVGGLGFIFGTVCDDHFDDKGATVACRQLGRSNGHFFTVKSALSDSTTGVGNLDILLDDVQCKGHEKRLQDCPHNFKPHDCNHTEDVGVTCDTSELLFSGLLYAEPGFIERKAGPVTLIDRDGYSSNHAINAVIDLSTTDKEDWRIAHKHFCKTQACNKQVCHYINENIQALVTDNKNQTWLMSRQRYPFNQEKDTSGIVRITGLTMFENQTENIHIYTVAPGNKILTTQPPTSNIIVDNTLLSLHPVDDVNFQLAVFPLSVEDGEYQTRQYSLNGFPLAISDQNVWIHKLRSNSIVRHPLHKNQGEYSISELPDASYPVPNSFHLIAAGEKQNYLYLAGFDENAAIENTVLFLRYNLTSGEQDSSWSHQVIAGSDITSDKSYAIGITGNGAVLLRLNEMLTQKGDITQAGLLSEHSSCSTMKYYIKNPQQPDSPGNDTDITENPQNSLTIGLSSTAAAVTGVTMVVAIAGGTIACKVKGNKCNKRNANAGTVSFGRNSTDGENDTENLIGEDK